MFAVAAVKLINSSPACVSGEKSFFLVLVLNTNISERMGRRTVNEILPSVWAGAGWLSHPGGFWGRTLCASGK